MVKAEHLKQPDYFKWKWINIIKDLMMILWHYLFIIYESPCCINELWPKNYKLYRKNNIVQLVKMPKLLSWTSNYIIGVR